MLAFSITIILKIINKKRNQDFFKKPMEIAIMTVNCKKVMGLKKDFVNLNDFY